MLEQRLEGLLLLVAVTVALEVQPWPTCQEILDCMDFIPFLGAPREQYESRCGARSCTCGDLGCQACLKHWINV